VRTKSPNKRKEKTVRQGVLLDLLSTLVFLVFVAVGFFLCDYLLSALLSGF